jgi:transcriptional regulator with XRE-family HTH domain
MNSNPFKHRREELDISQREVASRIGCTIQQVFNWEHDRAAPVRICPRRLALAYEVDRKVMREWILELINRSSRRRLAAAS